MAIGRDEMRETVTKIALTPAVLLVTAEVHELPTATYGGLMGAPSMGQFYNANIKGSGSDGPYDAGPIGCRATERKQIVPTPAALPAPPFEQHWEVFCEARITPGVADG